MKIYDDMGSNTLLPYQLDLLKLIGDKGTVAILSTPYHKEDYYQKYLEMLEKLDKQ